MRRFHPITALSFRLPRTAFASKSVHHVLAFEVVTEVVPQVGLVPSTLPSTHLPHLLRLEHPLCSQSAFTTQPVCLTLAQVLAAAIRGVFRIPQSEVRNPGVSVHVNRTPARLVGLYHPPPIDSLCERSSCYSRRLQPHSGEHASVNFPLAQPRIFRRTTRAFHQSIP